MSEDYSKLPTEARLARLEAQSEKNTKAVKALATMIIFKASNPFDAPLKQFFDDAEKFFEDVYDDVGACYNRCFRQLQSDLKAAGDDQAKRDQAYADSWTCTSKCPPLRF
jgi:hypothetical protein